MKKLLLTALLVPVMAFAQTYPSPTFNTITLQAPSALGTPSSITLTNGTGLPVAGLSGLGTGVGNSLGTAVTGSGGPVLSTAPTIAGPTVTGTLTATGAASGAAFTTLVSPFAPTLATISALNAATSTTLPQSQAIVAGFSTAGDGGAGVFNIGATTTANGCTIFNDASGRSWYRQTNANVTNVRWCGAKGDGSTNDTTAFVNAVAVGKSIYAPDGNYQILDNNVVLTSGQSLTGAGWGTFAPGGFTGAGTNIVCTNNTGHACIAVAANASWVTLSNFSVNRSVSPVGTAISGSNGIQFNGVTQFSNLVNIYVYNQYIGIVLHDTTTSYVTNIVTQSNASDGMTISNVSVGPLQWVMSNTLSQSNAGAGYHMFSTAASGASTMSVSNMDKVFSFSNSGTGFAIVGTAGQPIYGPRLTNSFLGADGNDEVFFNGFGGDVQITDSFFELAGTGTTGPLGTTAASGLGSAINIVSGSGVKIANNFINGMSVNGITLTGGSNISVSGNTVQNNGLNASSAALGLFINTGVTGVDVTGNTINNANGNTTQKYGVYNSGTIAVFAGNDLTSNTTGSYTGTAPLDSCNSGVTCVFNQPTINQPNTVGVANGSNAAAGSVGEYLTANAGPTSLTSGNTASAASLSLTAGDWDTECIAQFTPAGTTVVAGTIVGVSTSATTFGGLGTYFQLSATAAAGASQTHISPVVRVSITTPTTYFCTVNVGFSVSTLTTTGFLRARRVH
jgi:hypothetical protein